MFYIIVGIFGYGEGQSLAHFDHVLHVVGHGYKLLAVDSAHTPWPLTLDMGLNPHTWAA